MHFRVEPFDLKHRTVRRPERTGSLPHLCKVSKQKEKAMLNEREDVVLTTREACDYLRISRPTYSKYLYAGRIKGAKAGKGWKVLKSELDRFLRGESAN